jgi:hypothetical protein
MEVDALWRCGSQSFTYPGLFHPSKHLKSRGIFLVFYREVIYNTDRLRDISYCNFIQSCMLSKMKSWDMFNTMQSAT